MKEFRHIMMIFALVALAAGCSKVEVVNTPEREISFTVGSYAPATKAVAVTEFTSFKSKGYLYAEGVTGAQDFFGAAGETITFNGTDTWAPSHPYYWPKGESSYINFVSWYDKNGAPSSVSETAISWTNRTIAPDDNILVADVAWRYKENTSNGAQYTGDAITSGVPTLFHHVLSRVQINVRATVAVDPNNANVTYEVSIQNARLEGIYQTGTMSLANTEMSSTGTRAWVSANNNDLLWSAVGNAENVAVVSSNTIIPTTATAILPVRSFMPQNLGNDAKLVISYTITTKSGSTITSSESDIPATLVLNTIKNTSDIAINQWAPNKIYTYNLVINPVGDPILIEPAVEADWTAGNYSVIVE